MCQVNDFNLLLVDANNYSSDPLSCSTVRIASRTGCQPVQSAFTYNNRSEVVSAAIGTNLYGYSYDTIGNRLWSADNIITNSYSANSLNQYTTVGRAAPSAPPTSFTYAPDGIVAHLFKLYAEKVTSYNEIPNKKG